EKSRSVVTDGDGRYSIVNLRPGTYDVTFTLAGFSTFKRDGIIVPADTTVPLNADLRVGALEETVTVSGESPVVDVQNTARQQIMTRDLMDTIPSARNIQSVGSLVPGIRLNIPDVGGSQQTEQTYMAVHGNTELHTTILLDGMPAQTNLSDGAVQNYIDNALIAEATYQTSGVSAETSAGGIRLNLIPKDGGNTLHGSGFFAGTSDDWNLQASNLDDELRARGLTTGARVQHLNDFNGSAGGPVLKDKLWWFGSLRHQGTFVQVPNTFKNDGSPGIEDAWINNYVVRGTLQATPRNKVAVTQQRNYKYKMHEIYLGGQEGLPIFPEQTAGYREPVLYYIAQAKWTAPITNRLLMEAGYSGDILHYSDFYQPGTGQVRGTQGWFANASRLAPIPGRPPGRTRVAARHDRGRPAGSHRRRPVQSAEHARSAFGGDLALLCNRHAQHQDRAAVCVGEQPGGGRHERRSLPDLSGRHVGQRRLHARPPGAGARLQHAARPLAAAARECRRVRAGSVGLRQVHGDLWSRLGVLEGGDPGRAPRRRPLRARAGFPCSHLPVAARHDLLELVVAASRRRLRPLRQRQDRVEGEFRQVHDPRRQH